MSLNDEERARTGAELRANLELSGASPLEVWTELGLGEDAFRAALDCGEASRPQDVWLLRDHLEERVRARGGTPVPYTVLTERMRAAAGVWFGVGRPPRRG
ncbi:DUF2316 family protein [Streptomyces sp. NPDC049879]|uniref:DUF2316 family protein n=1 Tax=Streptomyces sp. NPDC049879 TaxID=3365598 RepID=UPI00378D7A27